MGTRHRAGTRKRRRSASGIAAALAVPLVALPVGMADASAAATQEHSATYEYFPTEPTRVLTLSLLPGGNDDDLQGVMCESPRTCKNVVYSRASTPSAVAVLDTVLRDGTDGKQIVFAYSQGARVAAAWMREHGATEGVPGPENLSFVLMGNPARKYNGSDKLRGSDVFPDLGYRIIDVSQEYDMASDFPDDTTNLLAMLNSTAAFFLTHQDYEPVDIYDPANYVWTEGDITYVFVPTKTLPLLQPLRWFGLGFVADMLNPSLKEIVDRAYDRSYLPAQPGLPSAPDPEPEGPQQDSARAEATLVQSTAARTEPVRGKSVRALEPAAVEADDEVVDVVTEDVVDSDGLVDSDDVVVDDVIDGDDVVIDEDEAAEDEAAEDEAAEDADVADEADTATDTGTDTDTATESDVDTGDSSTGGDE